MRLELSWFQGCTYNIANELFLNKYQVPPEHLRKKSSGQSLAQLKEQEQSGLNHEHYMVKTYKCQAPCAECTSTIISNILEDWDNGGVSENVSFHATRLVYILGYPLFLLYTPKKHTGLVQ